MFEKYTESLYMDFDGQKRAEYYFERIVVLSSLIGLAIGYFYQQFSYAIISLGIGFILSVLISIPPWPMYRRCPLKWQKHNPQMFSDECFIQEDVKESTTTPATSHSNKKSKK